MREPFTERGTLRPRPAPSVHRVRSPRNVDYEVHVLSSVGEVADELARRIGDRQCLWVTSPTVHDLHARALFERFRASRVGSPTDSQSSFHVLPCSESDKEFDRVLQVCEWAQDVSLERTGLFVGVGGGVLTDIVTVAASLHRRGTAHVRVPTTVLGMVDAAVGAKGAVNHGAKKSALGCFHAPELVLVHPDYASTLPVRHVSSGLAEVVKVALARDAVLFERLESGARPLVRDGVGPNAGLFSQLVKQSVAGILGELAPNLFEDRTFERRMDLGHTFSPILEVSTGFDLTHGEAVAVDMSFATLVAEELGWLSESNGRRIRGLVSDLGLPIHDPRLDEAACDLALREAVRHRGGRLLLFVPDSVGSVRCIEEANGPFPAALRAALRRWGDLA